MTTVKTNKGEFLLIEVSSYGINFVADMGYLIFKTPNYETWIKDKDLWDYEKLLRHEEKCKGKDEWKQAAIRLPDGDFKFVAVTSSFVLDKHEASQNLTEEIAAQIVNNNGMNCYDNYRNKIDERYTCSTAMDSFKCLLAAANIHNIAEDKAYAILRKLK